MLPRLRCPGLDESDGRDWPAPARAVLDRAARRHGGWERWRTLGTVELQATYLGGLLPRVKGLGATFPPPGRMRITPREGQVSFLDYPRPGLNGHYQAGDVSLVDPATGEVLQSGPGHRRSFAGLAGYRRWQPLDALYFFGYALANYLGLPFLLRGCRLVEVRRWRRGGQEHDGLTVDFPAGHDTHGGRQSFYFAPDGLLVRHDYRAEIVGFWADGSHFSSGYVEAGGMPFATRRRVVATLLGRPSPLPVLEADLEGFRCCP